MDRRFLLAACLFVLVILLFSGCGHKQRNNQAATTTTSIMGVSEASMTTEITTTTSSTTRVSSISLTASSTTLPALGGGLSKVKVAIVYERVSDGVAIDRSVDDVVNILDETETDMVFRSFYRWQPVPESSSSKMPGYPDNYVKQYAGAGYTYEQLGEACSKIKAARPDVIIIGGIVAGRVNRIEFDDKTGATLGQEQTWAMAWDPSSFSKYSKTQLQCLAAARAGWISNTRCPKDYDPATVPAYLPDITNEQFQKFLLTEAEKQIDLGADGIWVDLLYQQVNALSNFTGDLENPAVKTSYEASSKLVDEIHAYGISKGKEVYVGTWWNFVEYPYPPPNVDFVTATPSPAEVKGSFDDEKWDNIKSKVSEKLGDVPILVFIDWSGSATAQMGVFSQDLTPEQQKEYLKKADDYFTKRGMIFVYPVHGGTFPRSSKRLSFGKYGVYDSLAPEFTTYETIKELAQNKSRG